MVRDLSHNIPCYGVHKLGFWNCFLPTFDGYSCSGTSTSPNIMNTLTTSRSAYQSYMISPRLYFITYQYSPDDASIGQGIVPKLVSPDLALGTFCHEVCGAVMGGGSEELVLLAQTENWNDLARTRGFDSPFNPDMLLALAQGLSKAWIRNRLPQIEKDYEILAVEQERELSIHDDDLQLLIPTRLDGELRNKFSGTYHALEMKTTRTKRSYYFDKYNYDIQTLQHLWTIENTYGPDSCHSILMEFLYKGYGLDSGATWYSPFVRAFVKHGVPPFDKTEYEVEGKFARRKDWNVFNVWEEFTQDEWYKLIGGAKLDGQLLNMAVVRSNTELPDFQFQMFEAHKRIAEGLSQWVGTTDPLERRVILNRYFPLAYHSYDKHLIGFNPEQALESGDYLIREPHHALERKLLANKTQ